MIIIDISHPVRLKKLSRPSSNFENAIRRRPVHLNERLNDSIANSLPVHSTAPVRTRELSPAGDSTLENSTTQIEESRFEEELQKRSDPLWRAARYARDSSTNARGSKDSVNDGLRPGKGKRKSSWKRGRMVVQCAEASEERASRKDHDDTKPSQLRGNGQRDSLSGADERHRSQDDMDRESPRTAGTRAPRERKFAVVRRRISKWLSL